ncbi:hypothetical protein V8E54_009216 [Elaphomyces granulatus]
MVVIYLMCGKYFWLIGLMFQDIDTTCLSRPKEPISAVNLERKYSHGSELSPEATHEPSASQSRAGWEQARDEYCDYVDGRRYLSSTEAVYRFFGYNSVWKNLSVDIDKPLGDRQTFLAHVNSERDPRQKVLVERLPENLVVTRLHTVTVREPQSRPRLEAIKDLEKKLRLKKEVLEGQNLTRHRADGETREELSYQVARTFNKGLYFARKIVKWEGQGDKITGHGPAKAIGEYLDSRRAEAAVNESLQNAASQTSPSPAAFPLQQRTGG